MTVRGPNSLRNWRASIMRVPSWNRACEPCPEPRMRPAGPCLVGRRVPSPPGTSLDPARRGVRALPRRRAWRVAPGPQQFNADGQHRDHDDGDDNEAEIFPDQFGSAEEISEVR